VPLADIQFRSLSPMEAMDLGIDAQGTRVRTREKDRPPKRAPLIIKH